MKNSFSLRIPDHLPLDAAAPSLCAGITTYSPLVHYGLKARDTIAVNGLGGLGHMGVQFANAMGAHVTVMTRSADKKESAVKLGADNILLRLLNLHRALSILSLTQCLRSMISTPCLVC